MHDKDSDPCGSMTHKVKHSVEDSRQLVELLHNLVHQTTVKNISRWSISSHKIFFLNDH